MDILLLPSSAVDSSSYRAMMQKYLGNPHPFISESSFSGIAVASPISPSVAVGKDVENIYLCLPELPHEVTGMDAIAIVNSVMVSFALGLPSPIASKISATWAALALYMITSSSEQLKEIRTVKTVVDEGAPPMIHFSIFNQF